MTAREIVGPPSTPSTSLKHRVRDALAGLADQATDLVGKPDPGISVLGTVREGKAGCLW